jgi:hypothetical protein
MERCPICRASLNGAETCRRCRAELGSVLRTERMAEQLRALAMHRFVSGDPDTADRLLQRSLLLHRTPETLTLWKLVRRQGHVGRPPIAGSR